MKSFSSSAAAGNLLQTPKPSAAVRSRSKDSLLLSSTSNRSSESNSVCSSSDLTTRYSDSGEAKSSDSSSKISKVVGKSLCTDFSSVSEVSVLSGFSDPLRDPEFITGNTAPMSSETESPQKNVEANTIVAEKNFGGLKQGVTKLPCDGGDRSDEIAKLVMLLCELLSEINGNGGIKRKGLADPVLRAKLRLITLIMLLFIVIAVVGLLRLELHYKNFSIDFAGLAPT